MCLGNPLFSPEPVCLLCALLRHAKAKPQRFLLVKGKVALGNYCPATSSGVCKALRDCSRKWRLTATRALHSSM